MPFLLSLLFSLSPALAADVEWANMPKATPIYAQAREGAPILVMTSEGEKIAVRQRGNTYTRVQFKRGGKWKVGYIFTTDLENPQVSSPRGGWGFGGGGMYSYLRHSGKEFETDDQVKYSTEEFTSGSFSPFLMVQYGQQSFWRFIFAYRLTDYSSTASTDVPGAGARSLTLEHTMLSGTLQKLWTPFAKPILYYGLGIEVSRSIDANLVLGNNKLPVNSQDLPTYLGGHLAAGGQFDMTGSLSAFGELRFVGYFNQSPMILGAEAAAGLLWWP